MRTALASAAGLVLLAGIASAQTADEIVVRYLKAVGGEDRIKAVTTLRRTGTFYGGGGFEAAVTQENKRPGLVREEITTQGLTGVNAFDGHEGWKIDPWQGRKDAASLEEEELKGIIEDADFDGPLVDYRSKGNTVEYLLTEPVEGTATYKLRVSLASGGVHYYSLDTESCVPIKIEIHRMVFGAERVYETFLVEYKNVAGWYLPYSVETNVKGSQDKSKVEYERIDANVPLDDRRFARPGPAGTTR
jgi:hypothetical protein